MKRSSKSNYDNVKGLATIKLSPEKDAVAVIFDDKETHPDAYKLTEFPELLLDDTVRNQKWFVQLTNEKDAIWQLRPGFGTLDVKFVGFASKDGEPPQVQEQQVSYVWEGKQVEYVKRFFTALYHSVEHGEDVTIPFWPRYNFVEDNGMLNLMSRGKWTEQLEEWLNAHNVLHYEIPYKDNNLPDLETLILQEDKILTVFMKDGYISDFSRAQGQEEVDDPIWDETVSVADAAGDTVEWD